MRGRCPQARRACAREHTHHTRTRTHTHTHTHCTLNNSATYARAAYTHTQQPMQLHNTFVSKLARILVNTTGDRYEFMNITKLARLMLTSVCTLPECIRCACSRDTVVRALQSVLSLVTLVVEYVCFCSWRDIVGSCFSVVDAAVPVCVRLSGSLRLGST